MFYVQQTGRCQLRSSDASYTKVRHGTAWQCGVGPTLAWPVNQGRTLERMGVGEGQRKYLDCFGPSPEQDTRPTGAWHVVLTAAQAQSEQVSQEFSRSV